MTTTFAIIETATSTTVATAVSQPHAQAVLDHLQRTTLRPHHLRALHKQATRPSALDRAYESGAMVWDGDILVPARRSG